MAHEIAHSYFGYVVSNVSPSHEWLSESFSDAVSMFAIEKLKSKGDGQGIAAAWKRGAKQSTDAAPIYLANELAAKISTTGDDAVAIDRADLVYSKGAFLLHTIRRELGDDLYFTTLRSFLRNFEKRGFVKTDDFVAMISFTTKKDWKPWFEKYYYGTEMP